LEHLAKHFAIEIAGYAILDNHLHILLRVDVEVADRLTSREIANRWGQIYPPRNKSRRAVSISEQWLENRCQDYHWIETRRARLKSLSWFMKCLKEELARKANKQDGCSGAFFEGRFKSIPIEDEESLLAVCTYIDLNPFAAGISKLPEHSPYTSLKYRVSRARQSVRIKDFNSGGRREILARNKMRAIEKDQWLCPLERVDSSDLERNGMLPGLSLGIYLKIIDFAARQFREGKARLDAGIANIFDRLSCDFDHWSGTLAKICTGAWRQRTQRAPKPAALATA
jgi:hypothetical protein